MSSDLTGETIKLTSVTFLILHFTSILSKGFGFNTLLYLLCHLTSLYITSTARIAFIATLRLMQIPNNSLKVTSDSSLTFGPAFVPLHAWHSISSRNYLDQNQSQKFTTLAQKDSTTNTCTVGLQWNLR